PKGGAEKSIINISEGLKQIKDFKVEYYYGQSHKIIQKIFSWISFEYYFLIPRILVVINEVKPDVIITQTRISFAATLGAILRNKPIINIIRDPSDFCPKFVNVIGYGKACPQVKNRKICYDCIKNWRSIRILIGNKPNGWSYSLRASMSNIAYMIRYFSCKLNLYLLKRASIILVASELMKSFLAFRVKSDKMRIVNITPIAEKEGVITTIKKNQILFIIPSYDASHKGLDFVLRLAKKIPSGYKMIIVGNLISSSKLNNEKARITNYGRVSKEELNRLYQSSKITLVPSFFTEAFGRVIIESILNGTPVITSPNCGANSFLQDKEYVKVVPLKIQLWRETIERMIETPIKITNEERDLIYSKFSISRSIDEFSSLIKNIIKI
ncbi:MAG: glycosyltransferase family 4 protein, partial [Candidatus Thorarchaeota archaeon]